MPRIQLILQFFVFLLPGIFLGTNLYKCEISGVIWGNMRNFQENEYKNLALMCYENILNFYKTNRLVKKIISPFS